MITNIKKYVNDNMEKCINAFMKNIDSIKVGRANTSLLQNILIKCYDNSFFINNVANVTVHNFNTLKISAFDKSLNDVIKKSILKSNIGLNPYIKNNDIFVPIPSVTEEKRIDLIKIINKEGEKAKINIRIIRRDSQIKFKKFYNGEKINKDFKYKIKKEIQLITDFFINKIDEILIKKELEIKKE
ncbi:ribosome recycling factor [Buchnera aphidicola (Ceratoglyphina bambusae)]|uniref:ribosome recycling factor n=1 Tax=Buchnera aphidicola TaxID=9 RepID=UPI0031B8B181